MSTLEQSIISLKARRAELVAERARIDDEHSRIEAALAAVGAVPARSTIARSRTRKPGPAPGARRAPRGANRAKILAVASDSAKTVAEIATLTGVRKTVVATTVSTLTKRGMMQRDGAGYRTVAANTAPRPPRRRAARR
ncbi:MAG TPA: hypothetical protein VN544_10695 [Gaiellaceae bacterium]|nr:hypothetical protein [Gaiellaceae bacterium]